VRIRSDQKPIHFESNQIKQKLSKQIPFFVEPPDLRRRRGRKGGIGGAPARTLGRRHRCWRRGLVAGRRQKEALHPINGGARAAASQEEIMEVRGKWPNELVYGMEAFDSIL
jgi:hypothetical protein